MKHFSATEKSYEGRGLPEPNLLTCFRVLLIKVSLKYALIEFIENITFLFCIIIHTLWLI